MKRIQDMTEEEVRAESERLRARREKADRDDANQRLLQLAIETESEFAEIDKVTWQAYWDGVEQQQAEAGEPKP